MGWTPGLQHTTKTLDLFAALETTCTYAVTILDTFSSKTLDLVAALETICTYAETILDTFS